MLVNGKAAVRFSPCHDKDRGWAGGWERQSVETDVKQ